MMDQAPRDTGSQINFSNDGDYIYKSHSLGQIITGHNMVTAFGKMPTTTSKSHVRY